MNNIKNTGQQPNSKQQKKAPQHKNKAQSAGSTAPQSSFLPVSRQDMQQRGWQQCDIILISADAYVDHPGFAIAILGRVLEAQGYKVGIIAQPDWHSDTDFLCLGQPRLFFGVSGGNIDSMVSHYTAAKKRRSSDAYSPGGKTGLRPDRPTIVYSNILRRLFGKIPIVIGGIEASLRRFAHYDYWDNRVRHSILIDSGADLLSYGMGEETLKEIAHRLNNGETIDKLTDIRGTVYRTSEPLSQTRQDTRLVLPSFDEVSQDKKTYARTFAQYYREQDAVRGRTICQNNGKQYIIQNPPVLPLTETQMDAIYELPYTRSWHPAYEAAGGIPALEEVKFSIVSHRGCFGECNFCSLLLHQGRVIQSRSCASIVREAKHLSQMPDFKGYIHDIGGPSANFWQINCQKQKQYGCCPDRRCLFPQPCPQLPKDQQHIVKMLQQVRKIPGIKKVFIRSGVRYDYALCDTSGQYLPSLCRYHVSGQLKVAPEHTSGRVTTAMGKPPVKTYEKFIQKYNALNKDMDKKQYLVPYFIASHPACGLKEMIELAEFIKRMGHYPQQVQDFTPTPMTASTCMYYSGYDPFTMEKVYTAKSSEERKMQRALMQFNLPENRDLVEKALTIAGRRDLIGYGPRCLIRSKKAGPTAGRHSRGKAGGSADSSEHKLTGNSGRGQTKSHKAASTAIKKKQR